MRRAVTAPMRATRAVCPRCGCSRMHHVRPGTPHQKGAPEYSDERGPCQAESDDTGTEPGARC